MIARILLVPVVLLSALALAAPEASAHGRRLGSHGRHLGQHGRRIGNHGFGVIGARVAIPVGHRGGYWREVVEYTGGYHETRTRDVEVRGRQIGFDFEGRPLYAGSRIMTQTYQVWIPRQRVVRRVWVPGRPAGVITIGGRVRVR